MRIIKTDDIIKAVAEGCIRANRYLPGSLAELIGECAARETEDLPRGIFSDMEENLKVSDKTGLPICQDTGMAVIFAEIGQDVHIEGGSFERAVNDGVAKGYTEGLLRCSVVADPIRRGNTGNNTPAVIHTRVVEGDRLKITVAPKGFGSENKSRIYMLTPAASREDIIEKVCETMRIAGGDPCPPVVLGVGLGGDFEYCALLAKKALCRDVSERHSDPYYARLEEDMLAAVNALGIGPQGFGGRTTALCVNIETYPTHIAGLPLAVNVGCHVTRHTAFVL